jgi:uridine kinase
MNRSASSLLVAIVGGSGAGKTWLAGQLRQLLRDRAVHLSLDDFYQDRSHLTPEQREHVNYDHPRAIDWPCVERVLADCRAGRPTCVPRYDFKTHTRSHAGDWRQPKPVVLMDGLWLLRRPAVRRLFQVRIFIDCPARVRLSRRLARDVAGRGGDARSVRRYFRKTVLPMHRRFVATQVRWANVVLKHRADDDGLAQLGDQLWGWLEDRSLYPVWMRDTFRASLRALRIDLEPKHERR